MNETKPIKKMNGKKRMFIVKQFMETATKIERKIKGKAEIGRSRTLLNLRNVL